MSRTAQDPGPTGHSKLPSPGNTIRTTATGKGKGKGKGWQAPNVSYPRCCYARASPGCQVRSRCSRAPRRLSHWAGGAVRHLPAALAPASHIPRPHSLEVEAAAVPVSTALRLAVAHQAGRARARRQNANRQRQRRRRHGSGAVSPAEPSRLWAEGACAEVRTLKQR